MSAWKTNSLRACALLLTLLLAARVQAQGAAAQATSIDIPPRLDMFVGDSRVLKLHARRVVLGNLRLLSVARPDANSLLLIAQAPGSTVLRLWNADNTEQRILITVTPVDLQRVFAEAQELLRGNSSVTARLTAEHVLLEGDFPDQRGRERAAQLASLHPSAVLNLVGKIGWEQTVTMDVRIVELRRMSWRDVGIRWQQELAGPRAAVLANLAGNPRLRSTTGISDLQPNQLANLATRAGSASVYFGIASSLDSRLHLLEEQGSATLLAEPTLSCRSGGSARFVSGGEIPLPVANGLGATNVEYKEYGVILAVQPVVASDGAIFAKIETELSQLDPTQAVLGVPALLKRKSLTEVNLRAGETLMIAGLTTRSRANGTQGLPGLSSARHGGALFGERSRRDERTELAIFLTAQVMQGQADAPPIAGPAALERAREVVKEAARD